MFYFSSGVCGNDEVFEGECEVVVGEPFGEAVVVVFEDEAA